MNIDHIKFALYPVEDSIFFFEKSTNIEELDDNKISNKGDEDEGEEVLITSFVWDFFITDHDAETDIVYTICQIKDCIRKYVHHGSTTNCIKHLRDDHHITEVSLSSKTPKEISNLK
ncbi:6515_t:CDS:2 [Diversispora eburnea]|uniref:6515_t:CDS:1 n=1 Tax=Diversispora eburnea TaxID=1213867 RepID=A0A9N9D5N9_9GLOM|nr:6515_t:CDS:2 [Diversispora eburnea]